MQDASDQGKGDGQPYARQRGQLDDASRDRDPAKNARSREHQVLAGAEQLLPLRRQNSWEQSDCSRPKDRIYGSKGSCSRQADGTYGSRPVGPGTAKDGQNGI